ncbi:MAG TPA: hypothetical protein DIU35_07810 [Candidatus Latescibacteria bacterium]|nr:hypothetical protein [Candidatus Latescibacterota bacterium]
MIPLISSLCYGPEEVCHLPRFWWKVLTKKKGVLDEEYPDYSGGLDNSVVEILGLDKETTLGYLRDNLPNYLDFEAWIVQQSGGSLDRSAVDKWNASVRNRIHTRPEKIEETYNDIGFDEGVAINSAVILNSLQDWQLFFKRDLDSESSDLGSGVIPLIASIDYGPLEICQLPRTWLKISLNARELLHADYPECGGGLDAKVLEVLGLDQDATVAHIHETRQSYLDFEKYVLETLGELDRQAIDEWNEFINTRVHGKSKRTEIHATVGHTDDGSLTSAVILNHIEDWHLAHGILTRN